MKRFLLVLLILMVVGGAAFSFSPTTFPSPIRKGNVLISPTISLGGFGYGAGGFVVGITGAVDYALPVPVMIGAEVGFAFITAEYSPTMVPILARVSWHPNFQVRNLDTYIRLKLGYGLAFGDFAGIGKWGGGFSGGFNVGVRYFISNSMGFFGEVGYDWYGLSYEIEGVDFWGVRGSSWKVNTRAYTWFHAGITFKF